MSGRSKNSKANYVGKGNLAEAGGSGRAVPDRTVSQTQMMQGLHSEQNGEPLWA